MNFIPTSELSWLSQSDEERRKVLDVIDLFRDRDTRDELGLGVIRDGFADHFFPGTSTIQTRARYFLIIPWVYQRVEQKWAGTAGIGARAATEERRLIDALLNSNDSDGAIGKQARQALKRLPSDVYWQGLKTLGIREFPGSREQLHRRLERGPLAVSTDEPTPEEGSDAPQTAARGAWHANLPSAPSDFPDALSLSLSRRDADYLAERILARAPDTLFAWLAKNGELTDSVPFPWLHPQQAHFPTRHVETLEHARCFSQAMHGSALLYNLLLAEKAENDELVRHYREWLGAWESELSIDRWDRDHFWELLESIGVSVPVPTRDFVASWLELLFARSRSVAGHDQTRQAVRDRELRVKGKQARLANDRALAMWGGAAGTGQLEFRWSITQTILRDIHAGRERDA
jgi:hypothetical protein